MGLKLTWASETISTAPKRKASNLSPRNKTTTKTWAYWLILVILGLWGCRQEFWLAWAIE